MTPIGIVTIAGGSGEELEFLAYSWDADFAPVGAVYMITKCISKPDGSLQHEPIYVGQTNDLSTHFDSHYKTECLARYGGNCVCVLTIGDEELRLQVASDITGAYQPVCND